MANCGLIIKGKRQCVQQVGGIQIQCVDFKTGTEINNSAVEGEWR